MEAAPGLAAAITAARAVVPGFHDASDADLVAAIGRVEDLGRLADALRIAVAAEVEARSDRRIGEGRLAFARGARDAVELVQQRARIPKKEARRRVALGCALAPSYSIHGQPLPGRFQSIGDAVAAGAIGVESARAIVNAWKGVARRVSFEQLDGMVGGLLETAATDDTEGVLDAAAAWTLILDPDGPEPRDRVRRRKRALKIGRTLLDGTTSVQLVLTPEHLALLKDLLASRRRGTPLLRVVPGGDDDRDTDGPEWREECGPIPTEDPRTKAQQDVDTLFEVLEAGAQAETANTVTATIHETTVTVTAAEVAAREGQAWAPGIMADLPMPVVEQRACTGGIRLLVTGRAGEPLFLSRTVRAFTPAQKRALTVSAGGQCQFPGCVVPAPYLQAHHVRWWSRDRGDTDVGNGIMLCSHHHHLVHARDAPVEIRTLDGAHHFVPPGWVGDPLPRHRARTGIRLRPPTAA